MSKFKPVADPALTWPLATPLDYAGDEIAEIALRKPTGLDLMMVGCPMRMTPYNGANDATVDYPVAYAMLSRLSDIPLKVLQAGDPAEMTEVFWAMGTFFTPGLQTTFAGPKSSQAPASAPHERPAA